MTGSQEAGVKAMPTKAMLLAAGTGTRLRPFTETVSKCMVRIAGKPILEHNIAWLRKYGVTDIVINLHYLPETVKDHFGDGRRLGVNIDYSFEPELLGTAGAVRKVADSFDGPFFVWYGDNLSSCRLDHLWKLHSSRGGAATIGLHHRDDPTQSGIVDLDENDRITRFLEKPRADQVFSHWVSAGILVIEKSVIGHIPWGQPSDFGRDVFPYLLSKGVELYGYRMAADEELWWIDTVEDLQRVQTLMNDRQSSIVNRQLQPVEAN
jgi:NDP-sugar pyrophosphorylase family protein